MRGSLLAAAAALLLQLPLVDGGFRGSFRAAAWAARSEARQLNTSGPSSAGRRVGPVPDASQSLTVGLVMSQLSVQSQVEYNMSIASWQPLWQVVD
jgi:hypothetical protein